MNDNEKDFLDLMSGKELRIRVAALLCSISNGDRLLPSAVAGMCMEARGLNPGNKISYMGKEYTILRGSLALPIKMETIGYDVKVVLEEKKSHRLCFIALDTLKPIRE